MQQYKIKIKYLNQSGNWIINEELEFHNEWEAWDRFTDAVLIRIGYKSIPIIITLSDKYEVLSSFKIK